MRNLQYFFFFFLQFLYQHEQYFRSGKQCGSKKDYINSTPLPALDNDPNVKRMKDNTF